jgi:hypothetical protein
VKSNGGGPVPAGSRPTPDSAAVPLVIATSLREEGITGVHTHVRQLRRYLAQDGTAATLVTPFSWGGFLSVPVFGLRLVLKRCSRPASVMWYRHWHEIFLYRALRRHLAQLGDYVVYAQGPPEARAALRARRGSHERVVMAVHFRISQADEWADKKEISPGGAVFRAIRRLERQVIPQVDRLVYVSRWARKALLGCLPEAASIPSAVIGNFVAPVHADPKPEPTGDLVTTGNLDIVKNHRFLLQVLAEARRPGGTSPWMSLARARAGKTSGSKPARWALRDRSVFTASALTSVTSCQATGPMSMRPIPNRDHWRSWRRWPPAFPSWGRTSGPYPSSVTTAWKAGSGLLTTRLGRAPW